MSELRYITIEKHAELSGYTPGAIRTKISRGFWLEGQVWVRSPDGRILIDTEGYEKWAAGEAYAQLAHRPSR